MRTCAGGTLAAVAVGLMAACAVPTRAEPTGETTSGTQKPGVSTAVAAAEPPMGETNSSEADPPDSNGEAIPSVSPLAPTETASSSGTTALPCTRDAGACSAGDAGVDGGVTCPGCVIAGECVAADAIDPESPCQICDPQRNAHGWSPHDGVTCDDGLFCTTDDVCTGGVCAGTPRKCEDGISCNGVSTCDETAAKCTDDVNQCGANAICDTATDKCVSTCTGCLINGVCTASGTASPGNSCSVCDPTRSTSAFSAAVGKACGSAATACSQQDTCNAQGQCQVNNLPAGTPCGSPNSSACDQPDACDGNGNCQQRLAANGTACDDGQFCTVGDQCQGGRCVSGGSRSCGANQTCSNATNSCQCQGCTIGGACLASGARNPSNPCQVCDPSRNAAGFSPNMGAQCGAGATDCSAQDTCNAQGQCIPNDFTDQTTCNSVPGGVCQSGKCIQGDTVPPSVPTTAVIATVIDGTSIQLSFFLPSDNVTPTAAIEYAVFYANPFATSALDGGISPEAILALSAEGEVQMGRAFSPLAAGNTGTIVVRLVAALPTVEAVIIARDQAGNMVNYPPARVSF